MSVETIGVTVMTSADGLRILEMIKQLRQEVDSLKKTSVQWLTPAQAKQALNCGDKKLKSLRESGKIEARPYGTRSHRYLASSIEACFEKRPKGKVLGRKLADKPYPRLAS